MESSDHASWIVTRVNGKISSIAADYRHFADIARRIAAAPSDATASVSAEKISTMELLSMKVCWDDFMLFGSSFRKKVWKSLFDIATCPCLYSYSDFAAKCGTPSGTRAVAHAVAANPVAYLIPCHLIVPKETIDRVMSIQMDAQSTLFKGEDLYLLDTIDVGQYAYGPEVKRRFIKISLGRV